MENFFPRVTNRLPILNGIFLKILIPEKPAFNIEYYLLMYPILTTDDTSLRKFFCPNKGDLVPG
jgi:hypothetical protein